MKTKKELKREQKIKEIVEVNSSICTNLLMQKLGLNEDSTGKVVYIDDETDETEVILYSGKECKINKDIIDPYSNLLFDPYTNIQLACSMMYWYICKNYTQHGDIFLMYLTNDNNLNKLGHCYIKFYDGTIIEGNDYNLDSLKYLDIIYKLDGSASIEFNELKKLDIDLWGDI
jgi:hypothetical protein